MPRFGRSDPVVLTLMIEPRPAATIRSPTNADNRNGPLRLRLTTASNSFSLTLVSLSYSGDMPALLISVVDLAEPFVGRLDQSVELIPAAHVHLVRHRGAAGLGLDLLGGGHAVLQLAAGDHHVGAAARGGERHLAAQPAAAAGDQDHLAGQIEKSSA